MPQKILIVEDNQDIRDLLCDHLSLVGYEIEYAVDGIQAQSIIQSSSFDLYLLDWMLPGLDGLQLCRLIKGELKKETPIIFLTAKDDEQSIILGLEAGASDYMRKPFGLGELTARIKVQLREQFQSEPQVFQYQNLLIDPLAFKVTIDGDEIKLTKSEYALLQHITQDIGHVFSRKTLVKVIQGDDTIVTERTIDTHMAGLRKKIGAYAHNIITIRGVGYKFEK